jgi:hypothetical protein
MARGTIIDLKMLFTRLDDGCKILNMRSKKFRTCSHEGNPARRRIMVTLLKSINEIFTDQLGNREVVRRKRYSAYEMSSILADQ